MEYLEIRKPLRGLAIYKAIVSDIPYFIRRCRDQPNPAKNLKCCLDSEFVAGIARD